MKHEILALASQSPRRKELLEMLGCRFDIVRADIEERAIAGERPNDTALRLAREKSIEGSLASNGSMTVGADTVVDVDGVCFGKPIDDADSCRMLRLLSGRPHYVHTGIAVSRDGMLIASCVETTKVFFRDLSDEDIYAFVESGEARDKAGSYSALGGGAIFIEKIEGCFFNVVGLPLFRLDKMLREAAECGLGRK